MENAKLSEVFEKVASCLTGNWVYSQLETNNKPDLPYPYFILLNQDNLSERLFIRSQYNLKGKVAVSLNIHTEFLQLPKRSVSGSTRINVSPMRSPKALAKDIERRLLPAAREEVRDTIERMKIDVVEKKTREFKLDLVNQILPIKSRPRPGDRSTHNCSVCFGSFQIESYLKEVRGEFSFRFEEFIAICHLIKTMREGE